MSIAISEEHRALQETARRFLTARCPPAVPRALLDAEHETLPPFWAELAELGWLGLHLPEAVGGQGYGIAELAVILDEMGHAVAPGPFLPTVLASAAIAASDVGDHDHHDHHDLLRSLADGSTPAALAWDTDRMLEAAPAGAALRLHGTVRPVLGAGLARLLVLPVNTTNGPLWCAVPADEATIFPIPSLDPTRRVAGVTVDDVIVPPERQLYGLTT
ncbi:MAG TPA: acyl-CoA dehydrogenase family protein, partial [Acidimicrobiales bacterium]